MVIELTNINFESEVLRNPGTVLVDFYTPSCAPCRMMAPLLGEVSEERADSLKVVKLNAWEYTDLAAQFRVNAVPTFVLFRNGRPEKQRTGACSKKELLAWVDSQN